MKMTLNIEPKPQTRPRFSKFGTYEDPKMKAWRRQCSQLIEQEYNGQFFDSISTAGYNKVDKKGIVWTDDSIVCDLRAHKKYSPNPRIEFEIKELE